MSILQDVVQTQSVDRGNRDPGVASPPRTRLVPSQTALAIRDLIDGARLWYVWGALGWQDIRQRYRRSKIGAFWLTISMAVMIGALGGLYSGLFNADIAHYLPHVAVGFVIWGFVASVINEGCNAFIDGQGSIKQVRLPLSVYVYRVVWRNLIIFGHNCVIVAVVIVAFEIEPGWTALLAIPALLLLCLNGIWAGLLLGLLSARFRDVPQIITNAMQVIFFLTPIIWQPEFLPSRARVLTFNPFYHAIELLRAPLFGEVPPLRSWLAMLAVTVVGSAIALAMYARCRWRVPYWV